MGDKVLKENDYLDSLTSYFYFKEKKDLEKFKDFRVFIDSGAFSAFTRGITIDIDEYCNWIKANDWITQYSVLDCIGDAEGTLKNQKYMEEMGTNPIPCFHANEDLKYLEYYCENYDYISLGGLVFYSRDRKTLIRILDEMFSIVKKYWPKKIHGFGMTGIPILERYPFYSVDSTSWLGGTKRSEVITFDYKLNSHYTQDKKIMDIMPPIDIIDFNGDKNWYNRLAYNVREYKKIEEYITNLWEERGIIWKD